MKAFNDFILIAKDSSIDSSDKMMSIFKVIDKFEFKLPTEAYKPIKNKKDNEITILAIPYVIASAWRLNESVKKDFIAQIRLRLMDPNGMMIGSSLDDVTFNAGVKKIKFSGATTQLAYTINGSYYAEMTLINKNSGEELCTASAVYEIEIAENN